MSQRTQTDVLRREIEKTIGRLPAMLRAFGLGDALTHLQAWVAQVDARLTMLEQVMDAPHADARERKLIQAALSVVEVARAEGQLDGAIQDEARPGGIRPGDTKL